jgi:hypothetical protein
MLERDELDHATAQTLAELQRHRAGDVLRDPERWYAKNMNRLIAPRNVRRVVKCVDGGVTLRTIAPLLIANDQLPGQTLRELQAGRLPPELDDFSVAGPGSNHSSIPNRFAQLPWGQCCGVVGHCQCGACNGNDTLADTSAHAFADALQAPYLGMVRDLDRPNGFHPEIGITLRYAAHILNPRRVEAGPQDQNGSTPDFDFSAWGVPQVNDRISQYRLITSIVRGQHGTAAALREGIPFDDLTIDHFRVTTLADRGTDRRAIEAEIDEGFDGLPIEKVFIEVPRA